MSDQDNNSRQIDAAVGRARQRWLVSMMINAGGRWAVVPGALASLVGIVLALAGWNWLPLFIAVSVTGLGGVALVMALAWFAYSKPGARGAPDWTLLLDRALGLEDALPTLLEQGGSFSPLIEERVAKGLDPAREKQAAPAKHWGALFIALLLALLPLAFWRPDPEDEPSPEQLADQPEEQPDAAGQEPSGAGEGGNGGADSQGEQESESGEGESDTGGGEEGDVRHKPDEGQGDGNGEAPPEGELPQPDENNPRPETEGSVGEQDNPPTQPPEHEDPELDQNLEHVKPDAGEGETRTEDRSRWVYDPQGDKLDKSTPQAPDIEHPGERSVPRTKLTSKERKMIEQLYKKLYD